MRIWPSMRSLRWAHLKTMGFLKTGNWYSQYTHPRRISNDLEGWLEAPLPTPVAAPPFEVRGWVFSKSRQIRSVVLRHPSGVTLPLEYGLDRKDVAAVYPAYPQATHCGFMSVAPMTGSLEAGTLEICAVFEDHTSETAFRFPLKAANADDPPSAMAQEQATQALRRSLTQAHLATLFGFLAGPARLAWPVVPSPKVSVIVPLYGRAELTLRCLQALAGSTLRSMELILVDNASPDLTAKLLSRVDGATIIRNSENLGFVKAINQGARVARGEYLLLLNSDAEVASGAVEALAGVLTEHKDVGAVGGRLILPDGRLQEAGSIVWRDGSCKGYGRGGNPADPRYTFRRDVDYCSGALMMTRRELFVDTGGFDEIYSPGYYEETDYCVRLHQAGHRVIYEPDAVAYHFEFASSRNLDEAISLVILNRETFIQKHAHWLEKQYLPSAENELLARSRPQRRLRILFVDDRLPHAGIGSGFPRALEILRTLADLGHEVSHFGMHHEPTNEALLALPRNVEILSGHLPERLLQHLDERRGYYDASLISRPSNMRLLFEHLHAMPRPLIYDAEAVWAEREAMGARVRGELYDAENWKRELEAELALARAADVVLAISESDRNTFANAGGAHVEIVSHGVEPRPGPEAFGQRRGMLFIGALFSKAPNADSIEWFVHEVMPLLNGLSADDATLTVIGANPPPELTALAGPRVRFLGMLEDVRPIVNQARVFIAPTRFSAGIPLKLIDAAALGIPAVATSQLARQLRWNDGDELLVADSPIEFAQCTQRLMQDESLWLRIRAGALARVQSEYTQEHLKASIEKALASTSVAGTAK